MERMAVEGLGFAHFVAQTDGVGKVVLLLLLLSVASWYLILTKGIANLLAGRRAARFLARFREGGGLGAGDCAFTRLARQADETLVEARRRGAGSLAAAGGLAEFLTRALYNEVDQEAARVEHGLTVLASAGSAAPYIGLFGTVWGIYHALVQIGMSGQGTLDKVAGPVGEALIMTALGLAVAIPSVLAHNAFNRRNRMWVSRLEAFAHELYAGQTAAGGADATGRAS